jgi:hypothetical protein
MESDEQAHETPTTEEIIARLREQDMGRAKRVLEAIARSATFVHIEPFSTDPEMRRVVPEHLARGSLAVALCLESGQPVIAMANPDDYEALEHLRRHFQHGFKLVVALEDEVKRTIDELYW